jgi:glutamyl/glutaminyl-tRNA synthetase
MATTPIVTRFAPSPTGYLHVGGARTALFAWLLARHHSGQFLLRIEDTDLARSTEESVPRILDDLRWLGLHWDNESIMYQSRRLEVYNRLIDDLIARDLAYKAYETPQELEAMRREAEKAKRAFIYRRRKLTDEQIRQYETEGRPHVVRFAMPIKEFRFDDAVLGPSQGVPADQVQEFVIRKGDGMPTYHFAVVVDDAEMKISHVLRGQEHLLNTVNHIALQEAFGYPRPVYAHLPVILNLDGSKMSKRDRDRKVRHHANLWLKQPGNALQALAHASGLSDARLKEWLEDSTRQLDGEEHAGVMPVIGLKPGDLPEIQVNEFRANGYLPEALLNFLALLGWNPGGDRERMSIDEMINLFDIKDIGRSNARFDRGKLLAFNTAALAEAKPVRLLAAFKDFLSVNPGSPLNDADETALAKVLAMKPGIRTLREVEEASRFFFIPNEQIAYDPPAVEKVLRKQQGLDVLRELRLVLEGIEPWAAENLESAVKQHGEQKQLGLGKLAQPIRVAVSGTTISPPIFQSLEFLGRAKTLSRIDRCLASLAGG